MYKVTLSMPIYNVAPYVERALLSALNQTFESIEYLIVDDKGTDNSMDIVRRIISEHPRGKDVRIIEHPYNIGTGATKNTAIDNAQGKYLFFMDSDDEITPDCIVKLYSIAVVQNPDVVAASYSNRIGERMKNVYFPSICIRGDYCVMRHKYNNGTVPLSTWNKLFNLNFLKKSKIRCVPNHTCEDMIFTFLVNCNAKSYIQTDDLTYIYYLREDSFTGDLVGRGLTSKTLIMFDEVLLFKKEYLRSINDVIMYDMVLKDVISDSYTHTSILQRSNFDWETKLFYTDRFFDYYDINFSLRFGRCLKDKVILFLMSVKNTKLIYLLIYVIDHLSKMRQRLIKK